MESLMTFSAGHRSLGKMYDNNVKSAYLLREQSLRIFRCFTNIILYGDKDAITFYTFKYVSFN